MIRKVRGQQQLLTESVTFHPVAAVAYVSHLSHEHDTHCPDIYLLYVAHLRWTTEAISSVKIDDSCFSFISLLFVHSFLLRDHFSLYCSRYIHENISAERVASISNLVSVIVSTETFRIRQRQCFYIPILVIADRSSSEIMYYLSAWQWTGSSISISMTSFSCSFLMKSGESFGTIWLCSNIMGQRRRASADNAQVFSCK